MKNKKIRDMILFTMLGVIMFLSKLIMESIPNVHPLAMFITVFTLVYRVRALIPLYVYVFLNGIIAGFDLWWVPYTYIWAVLWALVMLIPQNASDKTIAIMSTAFSVLHAILFPIMYAPFQALAFGLNFEGMISWLVVGIPYDIFHVCGNIVMSLLVLPLYKVMKKLENE